MRFLKYLYIIALIGVMLSCEDEDTLRIPQDFVAGPNARFQLDPDFSNLNFADIENAKVKYDFFSESTDLDRVELLVVYNSVVGTSSDSILIATYTQADINANRGVIRNVEYTSDELAKIAGLSGFQDLQGGDNFTFINITYMTDGRIYPSATPNGNTNVTPNIANSAGTTSWTAGWVSYVACPINAPFTGNYDSSPDVCYGGNFTGPITLASLGGPIYSMTGFNLYGFANRQINLVLVCGSVIIPSQSPGLSCAGNALLMQTASTGAGTYDENDDGTLTLRIDYPSTCGGVATNCEIVLTKQ